MSSSYRLLCAAWPFVLSRVCASLLFGEAVIRKTRTVFPALQEVGCVLSKEGTSFNLVIGINKLYSDRH